MTWGRGGLMENWVSRFAKAQWKEWVGKKEIRPEVASDLSKLRVRALSCRGTRRSL